MNIGAQLYTYLTQVGTATATLVSARVYPNYLPQNPTYPALRYQEISQPDYGNGSIELFEPRYQFDCFATTYAAAAGLADAVQDDLRNWGNPAGTPAVVNARDVGRLDDYDPDTDVHRIIVDVQFLICD